mmetsp:Transcript_29076/g.41488  ORF Transcript_29076/g.41488 Transcript_29076/m.41488 type:complete len:170 (-) Transcript_29076:95-604(-)
MEKNLVAADLKRCCGSDRWVQKMNEMWPFEDFQSLVRAADQVWWSLSVDDWLQAFAAHPKIGDSEAVRKKEENSRGKPSWEGDEQKGANEATLDTKLELQHLNEVYHQKFGFVFLICATGKSADEMLCCLRQRVENDVATELNNAAEEQSKITKLRLQKLVNDSHTSKL